MENKTVIIGKIQGYYLKGLNYKEIGKLLDISPRTVQRYAKECDCKELDDPKTLQQRAFELHVSGFSYSAIAKKLKISRSTVYLWHKNAKNNRPADR